jgi:hypothetical protein
MEMVRIVRTLYPLGSIFVLDDMPSAAGGRIER